MIRRHFIRLMTLAGASSVPMMHAAVASGKAIVTYHVNGFTCPTCAVGLDVMLERQKGVIWSKSDYKDAKTEICFHPDLVNEAALQSAIAEMGFLAERRS